MKNEPVISMSAWQKELDAIKASSRVMKHVFTKEQQEALVYATRKGVAALAFARWFTKKFGIKISDNAVRRKMNEVCRNIDKC